LLPDHNKETYKANEETVLSRGRCLIVLYAKIIKAFPDLGRLFNLSEPVILEDVWDYWD